MTKEELEKLLPEDDSSDASIARANRAVDRLGCPQVLTCVRPEDPTEHCLILRMLYPEDVTIRLGFFSVGYRGVGSSRFEEFLRTRLGISKDGWEAIFAMGRGDFFDLVREDSGWRLLMSSADGRLKLELGPEVMGCAPLKSS